MNFYNIFAFVLLISAIFCEFNDCTRTEITISPDGGTSFAQNVTYSPSSADDCKNRKVLEYDDRYYYISNIKEEDKIDYKTYNTHCCYMTYDGINYHSRTTNSKGKSVEINGYCTQLTDAEYDNIGEYIKYYQTAGKIFLPNLKIDCNSFYLKLGLLSLILFILF